jgi:glutaredoxin-dependent peroxiredoxin
MSRRLGAPTVEDQMSVDVGSKAPDFTLPNQDNQPVTLASLAGQNVVLAFFPAAFSSVCTKELCHFRDRLADLNAVNARVFGVSTDTHHALKAFAEQQGLNFPLLSDFNKGMIDAYGVLNPDMRGLKGIARRAVFVIDREGVVRHKEVTEHPGLEPDYGKIDAVLAEIGKTSTPSA